MKNLRKILFVDDDSNFLAAVERTLRKQFVFDTALSGQAALALLASSGPYAVIVADIDMPEMNGIELLSRVTAAFPAIIQVVLTGKTDLETFDQSISQGNVFRYIAKSFDGVALRDVLLESLERYETLHRDPSALP
jgi:DNA-binding NtrC family response regulator